jgi:hypothetical protein
MLTRCIVYLMSADRAPKPRWPIIALVFSALAFAGTWGCSDNAEGNPPRESISIPRGQQQGRVAAEPGKKAAAKGGGAAAKGGP